MDEQQGPDSTFQFLEPAPPASSPVTPKSRGRHGRLFMAVLVSILVTALVTASLCAGIGLVLYGRMQAGTAQMTFENSKEVRDLIAKANEMREHLRSDFLEELTDVQLLEAMIAGMANNLGNPYTFYMDPDGYALWQEAMNGSYSGIGASVILNKDGYIQVTSVIKGGPADLAGMKSGDEFLTVDGEDVTGIMEPNVLAAKVRGETGTPVRIGVFRPTTDERLEFTIVRGTIVSEPVRAFMLSDTIGYVHVKEFSEGLNEELQTTVRDLMEQGATSLVLDLRNDPGGSAVEVIGVLDFLLPYGVIATIKGRVDGKPFEESWTSDSAMGVPETMRYAILVNENTASASELLAGCLRDFEKARLFGRTTYGKGSGTITRALSDGSAVNITTFRYYLPSGYSIEGAGLVPDFEVDLPPEYQGLSPEDIPLKMDTQLEAALDYLLEGP